MFKLGLEIAEDLQIKLPTSAGTQKKQENSRKTSTSALLVTQKPLTVWITTNCGKFLSGGNTRPPYLPPVKPVQQLELDMEQQMGSKLRKEYVKAVYCHPAYLTYM